MVANRFTKLRPMIRVIILFGVVLVLGLVIYISRIPKTPPTVIKFNNGSLCRKTSLPGWEMTSVFSPEDDIYICGGFEIIDEFNLQQSVLVWVYRDGVNSKNDYEYFDIIDIQAGNQQLQIKNYFEPGSYRVVMRSGKRSLFDEDMIINSSE